MTAKGHPTECPASTLPTANRAVSATSLEDPLSNFIIIHALVNGKAARAKLDSASDANLVSNRFAMTTRLRAVPLGRDQQITLAYFSGKTSGGNTCTHTTGHVTFVSGELSTLVDLLIVPTLNADSDVILGVSWLRAHKVQIAWDTNSAHAHGLRMGPAIPKHQSNAPLSVSAAIGSVHPKLDVVS